jgi:transposase
MTMIIGCDFHPRFQQIAYVNKETGEYGERRLIHGAEAEQFSRSLVGKAVKVGIEATGNFGWFRRLIEGLGHEMLLGDASQIRATSPRKQKTDKRDARHILKLLLEDRFPVVWQPPLENEQLRYLLLHRCRLVRMRTRVMNQLDGMAKNEGQLLGRMHSLRRRRAIEALPLSGWYAERRRDLMELLEDLDKRIEPLDAAVKKAAESTPEACLLMTHPGVGPIVSLAYVLILGDWRRFPRGKQVGSYLGLIPAEDSSADKRRLGHISKQGNPLLRWLLVEAATTAQKHDPSWHRQYLRLSLNKHHGVAKVAIAHKLAVRLYWMLRSGQNYRQIMERGSLPQQPRPVAGDLGSHTGQSVCPVGRDLRPIE